MSKRGQEHNRAQKAGKVRDGYTCQICGSHDHVEGHHVVDYQYGGAASADNIVTLCHDCHHRAHKGLLSILIG